MNATDTWTRFDRTQLAPRRLSRLIAPFRETGARIRAIMSRGRCEARLRALLLDREERVVAVRAEI